MSNELIAFDLKFSEDQTALLKRTVCKGSTDDEFQLFMYQCKRTNLDPFAKQIHAVKRWDSKAGREVMSIQTGIDGYRLIADRTGLYEGQTEPEWCGDDGIWKTVWLDTKNPLAARVGVWKKGFKAPLYAVALWRGYAQTYTPKGSSKSELTHMWSKMGDLMISKCAESLALRKAFPQELSGVYTHKEMEQADNDEIQPQATEIESEKEEATRKRHLRAELNKLLQSCNDEASFLVACKAFQKPHGVNIWDALTFHNETETFRTLADEHRGRIRGNVGSVIRVQEEIVEPWIQDLANCGDLETFLKLEQRMLDCPALNGSAEHQQALYDKGRELGHPTFSDEPPID